MKSSTLIGFLGWSELKDGVLAFFPLLVSGGKLFLVKLSGGLHNARRAMHAEAVTFLFAGTCKIGIYLFIRGI